MPAIAFVRFSLAAFAALSISTLQAQSPAPVTGGPDAARTLPCSPTPGVALRIDRAGFAPRIAAEYGLDPTAVAAMLAQAQHRQSIIDVMTRPAEAKPWKVYRPNFISRQRIDEGRRFLAEHRHALAEVEANTGVPASLIVAILGVETHYGRNTGQYRVLDALYTLAFSYPKRAEFFSCELGQLFALAQEESLALTQLKGSYAGAMGWGQFMPSSYRQFAVDGDGDGRRDLFGSLPDVFASVANYFVAFGWQRGESVVARAIRAADAGEFRPQTLEPVLSLAELGAKGYRPAAALGHDLKATLVTLEGSAGPEYWLGFRNFYAITRYNRSALYAMAVHQLSEAIAAGQTVAASP